MAELVLVEELAAYLVAQGIGQRPSVAPSTSVPSIWLMPRDGAALPRAGENITVTLNDTLPGPDQGLMAWVEGTIVDVTVRSRQPGPGKLVQRAIKRLLVPFDAHGGRRQWMMNSLLVESSYEWRGDQPLPSVESASSDNPHVTYDRIASYRFSVRRKILSGLTLP
jgi:hypothetical protein